MAISADQIATLEHILNEKYAKDSLRFKMSVHFVWDRINDPRNTPEITLTELQGIFLRLTSIHLGRLLKASTKKPLMFVAKHPILIFPVQCQSAWRLDIKEQSEIIAITVMRKKDFKAKDELEFLVWMEWLF